ncbi:MAG: hypothetical protein O2912_09580 [Proteobacteria bacterium]|nr:hypothetical protein [Pseudomonadota bacterium]
MLRSLTQFSALFVCILFLLSACETETDSRSSGQTVWVDRGDTRLIFKAPELEKVNIRIRRFTDQSGRFTEEFAEWNSDGKKNVIAGLILSEAANGSPLTDPQDPNEVLNIWAAFQKKNPAFGPLGQSSNALGPVLWRRVSIGTRACVVFLQRWSIATNPGPNAPISSLSGYYCNAPGHVFPPSLADKVIKSLGLYRKPLRQLPAEIAPKK